ncbi:hypothetical protein DFH09DRAFT_1343349 [Mycena vulgaris]|nr:hypothetical protein DFH09DRAFT_1343349 [Mycena vulgaris]
MPCELPVFLNAGNYVSDHDHNTNKHKFWFLVLAQGLFTLKSDADPLCEPDNIIIVYTKLQAQHLWNLHCCKRHAHKKDNTAQEISDNDDHLPAVANASPSSGPPLARHSVSSARPACPLAANSTAHPLATNSAAKCAPAKPSAAAVKCEAGISAKRGASVLPQTQARGQDQATHAPPLP